MTLRKKSKIPENVDRDPSLAMPIETAFGLFRTAPAVTLAQIAHKAQLSGAPELTFYNRYSSAAEWLAALLAASDPTAEFETAIAAIEGEDAADFLRDAMRRIIALAMHHRTYFELALIESDIYHGGTLNAFTGRLLPAFNALLQKAKQTGQLRPLPDWMIARAIVALLIGFVASERAMPAGAQFAARLMPQRLWIDSLSDILLYGLIEDEARS